MVLLGALILYLSKINIPVLEPKGPIALKERNLIYFALALSLVVVIPVFLLLGIFAWKYRESNTKAKYSPELDHNGATEALWWVIPGILIAILSVVAWNSSHTLDPYRAIASTTPKIKIQVIALDWKWLFIYPAQGIAAVNFFEIPINTPVEFELTSDAPMNSFWIPQLGGQIYAMPGMNTRLNLMATSLGRYNGWSANISGKDFSYMTFVADSVKHSTFNKWINMSKRSHYHLTSESYATLSVPGTAKVHVYSKVLPGIFYATIDKYMSPNNTSAVVGSNYTPARANVSKGGMQ